ncbi:hypothetical protein SDC9_65459 [bioreactor metagenome]|uniref:Uncharacterized protein n=1 Tax=bioreactor metagenome TaxID=1076179 RepID=A0A644XTE9_9ZZZZ
MLIDHDERDSCGQGLILKNKLGIHSFPMVEIKGYLAKNILSHLGDQGDVSPTPMCCHCLVRALPPGTHLEDGSLHGLSRYRNVG